MVELNLSSLDGSRETYKLSPYLKKINVGTDVIRYASLQSSYPHLATLKAERYRYSDVELFLGQDAIHAILPMENFESDLENSPIEVTILLG